MPVEPLYLAIDQGTHASRAVVLDARGGVVSTGSRDIGLSRPQPDWAEQDGEEMVSSIYAAVIQALEPLGDRRRDIVAAGLASQRASCACWDARGGRPLSPGLQLAGSPRPRVAAAVRAAGGGGAPQDRALPLRALRGEQAALGAGQPAGRARGAGGGNALLGTAGELPRLPAHRRAVDGGRPAVRRAHAALEHPHARLGHGPALALRRAAGAPSEERRPPATASARCASPTPPCRWWR